LENIDSQTNYKIISDNEWGVVIKFTNFSGIDYDYKQSLFELPFTWDRGTMSTVLISEWMVNLFNWDHKNLSIGLLNTDSKVHNNK
jgi:hypothetical protein